MVRSCGPRGDLGCPADALGAWLVLAAPAVRSLAGASPLLPRQGRLARKLVSTPGVAELALLAADEDVLIPLAVGDLPLGAFARAQAYLVVPAASEGYDQGALVDCSDLKQGQGAALDPQGGGGPLDPIP